MARSAYEHRPVQFKVFLFSYIEREEERKREGERERERERGREREREHACRIQACLSNMNSSANASMLAN